MCIWLVSWLWLFWTKNRGAYLVSQWCYFFFSTWLSKVLLLRLLCCYIKLDGRWVKANSNIWPIWLCMSNGAVIQMWLSQVKLAIARILSVLLCYDACFFISLTNDSRWEHLPLKFKILITRSKEFQDVP